MQYSPYSNDSYITATVLAEFVYNYKLAGVGGVHNRQRLKRKLWRGAYTPLHSRSKIWKCYFSCVFYYCIHNFKLGGRNTDKWGERLTSWRHHVDLLAHGSGSDVADTDVNVWHGGGGGSGITSGVNTGVFYSTAAFVLTYTSRWDYQRQHWSSEVPVSRHWHRAATAHDKAFRVSALLIHCVTLVHTVRIRPWIFIADKHH